MRLGHRLPRLAPYVALALVASLLVVYAISARGDDSQRPRLHDSGIWVVNDRAGGVGRLDKSIGQMDAAFFAEKGDLDVVQQDAAVVAVDASRGSLSVIDPATIELVDGASAHVPAGTQVAMGGGTLAAVDPETGRLWATRFDPRTGRPSVGGFGEKEQALATVGSDATVAVTEHGSIVSVSAAKDQITTLAASPGGFEKPATSALDGVDDVLPDTAVTTVGEQPVLLSAKGELTVVGGPTITVDPASVLQQSGPAHDSVLLASPDGLSQVDLGSGKVSRIGNATASGTPSAPVRLGACAYGAWAAAQSSLLSSCGGAAPEIDPVPVSSGADLTFRVNRGQVVLNDEAVGEVYNVDAERFTSPDTWNAFKKKRVDKGNKETSRPDDGDRQKAQAKADEVEVRSGRTSVIHPLDNDFTPQGQVVRIDPTLEDVRGGKAVVSPDGQLIQLTPTGKAGMSLTYTLDDGVSKQGEASSARVTVSIASGNRPPELRPRYHTPELKVAAGGEIDIPLIGDWRDHESDPVSLEDVRAAAGSGAEAGTARVLEGGIIRFTAPPHATDVVLTYTVGDGQESIVRDLPIEVQGPENDEPLEPVARPDIAVGAAEQRIEIRPLDNDLPGSDPGDPDARLSIFGEVLPEAGDGALQVETDEESGVVTVTAQEAGTYMLQYEAGFGNAAPAKGVIRVDVSPAQAGTAPLAMPDAANTYGIQPVTVDVLANDLDPSGAMLTVESVTVDGKDQDRISASVVDGRVVRLEPTSKLPHPVTISYTVGNGAESASGEILVTPRPIPADTSPVTATDRVTVRAGGVAEVPVLDNDAAPAGGALRLATDVDVARAGVLEVEGADGGTAPDRVGRATVRGDRLRYVAPDLEESDTFTVQYVATNQAGETAPGRLVVNVIADSEANKLPTPPRLEGRVRAGGQVELQLPAAGVDPDGDPVSITGIKTAPSQGRVVEQRGDSLVYQAFPSAVGTDEFSYQVRDDRGGTATGTARVAVLPQAVPQRPRAVDDELSAAPGSRVMVDALANDQVDIGDLAKISLPAGGRTAAIPNADSGMVEVRVPSDGEEDVVVPYDLSNGVASSTAAITVHPVEGYNNPPVVDDVYVDEGTAQRTSIDVLDAAYDPDGDAGDLEVLPVGQHPGFISQTGHRLVLERGKAPRVVPFRVRDSDGGVAAASVFVPALEHEHPVVRADAEIRLEPDSSTTVRLSDLARSSSGGPVRFVTEESSASPVGVSADITGEQSLKVTAHSGYQGPGAVSFEVALGQHASEDEVRVARTAVVTVPVQVGKSRPVLACAEDDLAVAQRETMKVPITTLCHVWTSDPARAAGVSVDASISGGAGVEASADGGVIVLKADDAARDVGAKLRLRVSDGGVSSATESIPVSVVEAEPPRLAPIRVADLRAGKTRTVDLAPYFTPGLAGAHADVLATSPDGGVRVEKVSGSKVTIEAAQGAKGRHAVDLRVTDSTAKRPPASRVTRGRIAVEILNRPAAPAAPVPGRVIRSGEVRLSWRAPAANGAPIDRYRIKQVGTGRTWTCRSTTCAATGLQNGRTYRFTVQAHNKVGWSGTSATSRPARANAKPGAVANIVGTRVGNGRISIKWQAPRRGDNGTVDGYRVSWPGHVQRVRGATRATLTGLNNSRSYTFTVVAYNKDAGNGPLRRSGPLHSIGIPKAPRLSASNIDFQPTVSDKTKVTVRWPATDPNGPGPVRYTLYYRIGLGAKPIPGCVRITRTSCGRMADQNGNMQRFRVKATNAGVKLPGGRPRSAMSGVAGRVIVGRPAPWGGVTVRPTGRDGQVRMIGPTPAPHGRRRTVQMFVDGRFRSQWAKSGGNQLNAAQRISTNLKAADRAPHYVQLRMCNERLCGRLSSKQKVQTFGPIRSEHLIGISTQHQNGRQRARFTVRFDSNGQASKIRFRLRRWKNGSVAATLPRWTNKYSTVGLRTYTTSWKWFGKDIDRLCLRTVLTDANGNRKGSAAKERCVRH